MPWRNSTARTVNAGNHILPTMLSSILDDLDHHAFITASLPWSDLKIEKEAFVSGYNGSTTASELLLVCSVIPLGWWAYGTGMWILGHRRGDATYGEQNDDGARFSSPPPETSSRTWPDTRRHSRRRQLLTALNVETITLIIPLILCQSRFLYPYGVGYLCAEFVIGIGALTYRFFYVPASSRDLMIDGKLSIANYSPRSGRPTGGDNQHPAVDDLQSIPPPSPLREDLLVYRSGLMYMTFVAILAVDFRLFPRRFVKTEESGYSLMDLGAASFVFAGGLVSPRARQSHQNQTPRTNATGTRWSAVSITRALRRMLPLLFMGSLRLLTHQELDYQKHDTEYGTHWNFFFTLAWLEMLVAMAPVLGTLTTRLGWIAPMMVAVPYQCALTGAGLHHWILQAPRTCPERFDHWVGCGVLYANREGILGCIGYTALFLAAEWIGVCFWPPRANDTTLFGGESSQSNRRFFLLTLGIALFWRLLVQVNEMGAIDLPVSRRSTNAVFLVWTMVLNMLQLAALNGVDSALKYLHRTKMSHDDALVVKGTVDHLVCPPMFTWVNRHGLLMFVIANLLTGIVNLSINTMAVTESAALVILFVYITSIGAMAAAIDLALNRTKNHY